MLDSFINDQFWLKIATNKILYNKIIILRDNYIFIALAQYIMSHYNK